MEQDPSIVNLAELPLEQYGKGGHFAARLGRVGAKLGTRQIGCTLVVLEPGKRAWPYHLHYAEEELFVVLEGEGTLRYDDGEFPVRAGDVVLTPPGPGTAHQIINTAPRIPFPTASNPHPRSSHDSADAMSQLRPESLFLSGFALAILSRNLGWHLRASIQEHQGEFLLAEGQHLPRAVPPQFPAAAASP